MNTVKLGETQRVCDDRHRNTLDTVDIMTASPASMLTPHTGDTDRDIIYTVYARYLLSTLSMLDIYYLHCLVYARYLRLSMLVILFDNRRHPQTQGR